MIKLKIKAGDTVYFNHEEYKGFSTSTNEQAGNKDKWQENCVNHTVFPYSLFPDALLNN